MGNSQGGVCSKLHCRGWRHHFRRRQAGEGLYLTALVTEHKVGWSGVGDAHLAECCESFRCRECGCKVTGEAI